MDGMRVKIFPPRRGARGDGKKLVRVQFDMTVERIADLDRLIEVTEINGRRDIFNNSLFLCEWAITESRRAHCIASIFVNKEKHRHETEEVILLLALFVAASSSLRRSKAQCKEKTEAGKGEGAMTENTPIHTSA